MEKDQQVGVDGLDLSFAAARRTFTHRRRRGALEVQYAITTTIITPRQRNNTPLDQPGFSASRHLAYTLQPSVLPKRSG
jgi:hypothetical protein